MGIIDDLRKLIQDLVTPDLKSIEARLTAADQQSRMRDEALATSLKATTDFILERLTAVDTASKVRDETLARESKARDEALAAESKARDEALAASLASKVELILARMDAQLARMDAQHSTVMNGFAVDKRLEMIERQLKPSESAAA